MQTRIFIRTIYLKQFLLIISFMFSSIGYVKSQDNQSWDNIDKSDGEAVSPSGEVLKYGIFKVVKEGWLMDNPDSSTGKMIRNPTIELTKQTNRIPIKKGAYFAYQYRISNIPEKYRTTLRRVVTHPEMTRPDGTKFTGSDYLLREPVKKGEVFDLDGYAFSEDYEMVAGDWAFQIWYKEQLLIEQKFTSYWPKQEEGDVNQNKQASR